MEAPGGSFAQDAGGGGATSWLVRGGLYLAPLALTVAYANRHTLSRLWQPQQGEVDEKGRPIAAPASAPLPTSSTATSTSASASSLPTAAAAPGRGWRSWRPSGWGWREEEKERADDGLWPDGGLEEGEAEERLRLARRTIMRMAREGDAEGLQALLDSLMAGNGVDDEHGMDDDGNDDEEGEGTGEEVEEEGVEGAEKEARRRSGDVERRRRRLSRYLNFLYGRDRSTMLPPGRSAHGRRGHAADGADAYDTEVEGCSPLFVAALNGHHQAVLTLLANGADPHLRSTQDGVHPLFVACLEGFDDVVHALVDAIDDASPSGSFDLGGLIGVESDGCTLLMGCCEGGHFGLARQLLERGVNVDARSPVTGATALFYATQQGHDHIVRLLALDHHCDVNIRKDDGSTALFLAVLSGRVDIVRILLIAGADIHALTDEGDTPLTVAANLRSRYPYVHEELLNSSRS